MALFERIRDGLRKTREGLRREISALLGKGKLTAEDLDALEARLIGADLGVHTAAAIVTQVREACRGGETSPDTLLALLRDRTLACLPEFPLLPASVAAPHVILVLGVNGVGKTTSIAKLAHHYKQQGLRVLVAAADTFRAGAVEQLEVWCGRAGVELVKHNSELGDPAAVAYDAYAAAKARGHDVLLIDTSGRLHNKGHLMEELRKIVRVLKKHDPALPHETLLVIDGNTGQNAQSQAKTFHELTPLSGFVVTKLDGTARGGILVSLAHDLGIPVRWVGVGEGMEDLLPFDRVDYVNSLFDSPGGQVLHSTKKTA